MIEVSKGIALKIAKILDDKKAKDVVILGLNKVSLITDFFIIASGTSSTQTKALADEIENALAKERIKVKAKEGYSSSNWILMDFGNVVVHIFHENYREFYDLERLWRDAERINLTYI